MLGNFVIIGRREFFSKYSREDGVLYYEGEPVNVTPADNAVEFADIQGHWAEEAIAATVEDGLFAGTSDSTFSPEESVNRGMAITVIGRSALAVGAPVYASETFEDVAGGYLRILTVPISAIGGGIGAGAYYVYDGIADMIRKGSDIYDWIFKKNLSI